MSLIVATFYDRIKTKVLPTSSWSGFPAIEVSTSLELIQTDEVVMGFYDRLENRVPTQDGENGPFYSSLHLSQSRMNFQARNEFTSLLVHRQRFNMKLSPQCFE